ncbi:9796_t:CDS:1, partial [Gigaspora margarita]
NQFDDQEFILVINDDDEELLNKTFCEQTGQTNIMEESPKKKKLCLELLEQENERIRNKNLFLAQKYEQIRNENLFLEQENK